MCYIVAEFEMFSPIFSRRKKTTVQICLHQPELLTFHIVSLKKNLTFSVMWWSYVSDLFSQRKKPKPQSVDGIYDFMRFMYSMYCVKKESSIQEEKKKFRKNKPDKPLTISYIRITPSHIQLIKILCKKNTGNGKILLVKLLQS